MEKGEYCTIFIALRQPQAWVCYKVYFTSDVYWSSNGICIKVTIVCFIIQQLWSNICKILYGKHLYDSTTTERWSNEQSTDLGDGDDSAFKQTRQPHLM